MATVMDSVNRGYFHYYRKVHQIAQLQIVQTSQDKRMLLFDSDLYV